MTEVFSETLDRCFDVPGETLRDPASPRLDISPSVLTFGGMQRFLPLAAIGVMATLPLSIYLGASPLWASIAVIVALIVLGVFYFGRPPRIFAELEKWARPRDIREFSVVQMTAPPYRYVDLFKACERWADERGGQKALDASDHRPLGMLLSSDAGPHVPMELTQSSSMHFPVGPNETEALPFARFWAKRGVWILRVRLEQNSGRAIVELATALPTQRSAVQDIVADSLEQSIFRGQFMAFKVLQGGGYDDDYVLSGSTTLTFYEGDPVSDDDIVLPDDILDVLRRNVLDMSQRREVLKAHDIPTRRGVLLHGPPGTGKTFTCRYLAGKLKGVTVLSAAGLALTRVGELFELARGLAPALVILEDVDLVFQSRDQNMFGAPLGSLMDELDGLSPNAEVSVLMTTNAIDRLESAIRDRPGRISQSIYFGPPSTELRRRYLLHALRDRDLSEVDMDRLVEMSTDAAQVFLKEWAYRALQFAVESDAQTLRLTTDAFERAFREMTGDQKADRIVGFRI